MPIKVKNWDKKPKDSGEDLLQIAFFAWYPSALPTVTAWHVRNQHSMDARQGAIMKKRGVLAGVHDVHLIWPGNYGTLELKSPTKKNAKMSDNQEGFAEAMKRCGHKTAMCQTGEQIVDALKSWGLNPLYPWPPVNKGAGKFVRQTVVLHELYRRHDDDDTI